MEQGPIGPEDMAETVQNGGLSGGHKIQHDRVEEQIGARQKQQAEDQACIVKVCLPRMDVRPG